MHRADRQRAARVLGRTTLPAGGDYCRIAIARGRAWITDGGGAHGSIVAVDLATRRVAGVVSVVCGAIVGRVTIDRGTQGRDVANDRVRGGGALWIAHFLKGTVTRVPLATAA